MNKSKLKPEDNRPRRHGRVNVLLAEDYLLRTGSGRKGEFQMGAVTTRNLTVLQKR